MTPVHEHIPRRLLLNPACIIQTIVENQECAWVYIRLTTRLRVVTLLLHDHLTLDDVGHNVWSVFVVNELGWNHMLEELVGHLCAGDYRSNRKVVLGVVQDIANQERLSCILLPDDDNHRTLARINLATVFQHSDVELSQLEVHCSVQQKVFRVCLRCFITEPKTQW